MNLDNRKFYRNAPEPGVSHGSGDCYVMFVALYGSRVPRSNSEGNDNDPFSRFLQRSTAMGWMSEHGGLWQLNDAGLDHPGGDEDLAAWYQVDVGGFASSASPIPAQPLMRCAVDATERDGSLMLTSVQLLLPVQGLSMPDIASRPMPSMNSVRWFSPVGTGATERIECYVSIGRDEAIPEVERSLIDFIERADPHTIRVTGVPTAPNPIRPVFDDSFWNGPEELCIAFTAELPGWNADAIGWWAEFLGDVLVRLGVSSPVLLSLVHAKNSNEHN